MGRRFVVSGIVQGVGFRFFTVRAARALNIRGWVRNLPDGRVEVLAQGDGDALDRLREDLARGPGGSVVHDVQEGEEREGDRYETFDIRM